MTDRHVVVLAGGLTHERDVSLRSGARIADALRHSGLEVTVRDADAELLPWLADHRPDAAIVALHGGRGENGAVQGILQMSGIPFVGTTSHSCRLAWDKPAAKDLVSRAGFSTPKWTTLAHDTFRDLGAQQLIDVIVDFFGLPLMIKPHRGGSALGAAAVHTKEELPAALVGAYAYGPTVLLEEYKPGTELAITVIDDADGARALPAVEVVFAGDIFDYESRYTAGLTTYHTPARVDPDQADAAAALAIGAHRAIGLRDVSRTDAIIDADGTVQFLEVNVSPGLTETSMLPMSVTAAGEDLGQVYSALVERAIARD